MKAEPTPAEPKTAEPTPASANAESSTGQGTSTTTSSSQSQERMYLVPAAVSRPDQDGPTMLALHLRFSPMLDLGASRVQVFVTSKHGIIACHPRLTPSELSAGRCTLRLKISELAGLVPGLLHVLVLQHVRDPQHYFTSPEGTQTPDPEARANRDAQTVLLAALPVLLVPPNVAAEVQRHFKHMVREVQEGTYYFLDQPETPGSTSNSATSLALNLIDAPVRAFQTNSYEGQSQESRGASQRREAALDDSETWMSPNLSSQLQQWREASGSRDGSDVFGDLDSSSVSAAQLEGAPRSISVPTNMARESRTSHHPSTAPTPESANAQGQHHTAASEAGGSGLLNAFRPPALFIRPTPPASMEEGCESLSPTAAWVSATAPPARPPSSQTPPRLGPSSTAAEQPSSPSATDPQAVEGALLFAQAAASSQASSGARNQQSAVDLVEPSSTAANEASLFTGVALIPSSLSPLFGHGPFDQSMQMLNSLLPSSTSTHAIHGAAARLLQLPGQPRSSPQTPQGTQPDASARAALKKKLGKCRFRPAEAFVSRLHLAPFAHHLDTLRAAAEQATAHGGHPGHMPQASSSGPREPAYGGADRQPATASSGGEAEPQVDLDAMLAAVCGFAPPGEGQAGPGAEPNPVAPSSLFGDVMASVGDSEPLRLRVPTAPAGLVDMVISSWREANQGPDAAAQAASVALTPALLRFLLQNRLIDCFELVGGWVHDAGLLSLVCGGHIVDSAEAAAYVKEQLAMHERPVLTVQGVRNVVQPLGFVAEGGEEEGSQEGQGRGGSAGDEEDELDQAGPDPWNLLPRSTAADDRRQLAHAAETQRAVLQPPAQESLPPAALPAADTVQLPRRNSGSALRAAAPGLLPAVLTRAQLFGQALGWAAQAFARGAVSLWRIATVLDAADGSVLQTDARVLLARLTMSGLLGAMVLTSFLHESSKEHWPLQEPRGSPVLAVGTWALLRELPVLLTMAFSPSAYMMYRPLMISGVLSVSAIQIVELLGEAAWELRSLQFPVVTLAVVYFVIEAFVTPLVLVMQQQLALLVIVTQVTPVALLLLTKLNQPPLAFGPGLEDGLPEPDGPRQREELIVPLTVVLGLGLVQLLLICLREHKSLSVGRQAA